VSLRKSFAAAILAAIAFPASGADETLPLSLDQALALASHRRAEQLLAETRGLPYLLVSPPRHEFAASRDAARIETMARLFDVILVDLDEAALSQRMSSAYVAWVRMRTRAPDATDTLRAQSSYQDLLARRNAAQMRQRLARSALAIALGMPDRLPAEVLDPALPVAGTESDAEDLLRTLPKRGAGQDGARRAHALVAAALELRWLVRDERARVRARNAVSERFLDDARARQDAGEPSDLGSAMAASVEARLDERTIEFAIAIARERIAALQGRPSGVLKPAQETAGAVSR